MVAPRGASPALGPVGSAGSTSQSTDMATLRNATNLRTVQRNDPAVAEILDTSTYSVIYHYDAAGEKWEKQKQEGSLFVVRRTKSPEYALYMLNRQAVKNVSIPLIPGEMKASVIDASMLQVARRGEKIKYGIWFTEGSDVVERFRDTIVRVCGLPTKTAGTPARASPAPAQPQQAQPAQADGLSRLFAGLTTVSAASASNSSTHSPQPASPMPSQPTQAAQHPAQPQPPHQPHPLQPPHMAYPPQFPNQQYPGLPHPSHPSSMPTQQFQPHPAAYAQYAPQAAEQFAGPPLQSPPEPELPASNYRPGETVDDLLAGILGTRPTQTQPPVPRQINTPPAPAQPNAGTPNSAPGSQFTSSSGPSSHIQQSTASPVTSTPKRSPPGPVPSQARRSSNAARGSISTPRGQAPPANGTPSKPTLSPNPMRDSLVDTFAGTGRPPPLGRQELTETLVRLLQTNEQFVEDVWRAYTARC